MLDGEAEQLLDLLVLAHLRQPQQALHQVQTLPEEEIKTVTLLIRVQALGLVRSRDSWQGCGG